MEGSILNKENVMTRVEGYALLNHYLKPYHKHMQLKQGQNISNPFLPEPQKTPSFNIYQVSPGNWLYKDFATGDEGDAFDLVMRLKGCNFMQALEIINRDFQLGLGLPQGKPELAEKKFTIKERNSWASHELAYWKKYGISSDVLNRFCVKAIESYTGTNKQGQEYAVKASLDNPVFAYEIRKGACYKIYRPLTPDKQYKFAWLGNKPANYYFGYCQLPGNGKYVFFTGGEKDVLSLSAKGHAAITCNSETAMPSPEIIAELKRRFEQVMVLYDKDETGMQQSERLCKLYGLSRILLPDDLANNGGKDISDFFSLGNTLENLLCRREDFLKEQVNEDMPVTNLDKLLLTQKVLQANKSKPITFSSPILTRDEHAIIYPQTINVLQGKAGVHKSRLAETICSALLKSAYCEKRLLDFKANIFNQSTVCYVDTERNLARELPHALQQIQLKAGYAIEEEPFNYDFISLLEIPRKERFNALTDYLQYIRERYDNHIFIVLDVISDCIRDFNRPEDSMQLIDLMNEAINKYNVTFLCLIHENPGSTDKARGHLGTEIMNKASTVMQVSMEKDRNGEPTGLICVNYLKCRSSKRHQPFYMQYDEDKKELFLADASVISDALQSRKQKANLSEVAEHLRLYLNEPMPGTEVIDYLVKDFGCSDRVIRDRLKELVQDKYEIIDQNGQACNLIKSRAGKEVTYELVLMNNGTMEKSLEVQNSIV